MNEIFPHLRRTMLRSDGAGLTDGELLECFVTGRDESAFAALVRRHAAMVWGVCRRILPCHHDAEDAFQATFLVLVRKAASVTPRHMVANWLYGVAHQTALNARASAARKRARERQVTEMSEPASPEQDLWLDLQPLLDQELSRLPARYRSAIVLCDLEGKTRKEAATQFGVPEGTLSGWLTRGRAMLARRLARHGLAVTAGALAAVLAPSARAAGVPASAVSNTIQAASVWAARQAAHGVISAPVAALTEGMLKTMLLKKLKLATVVFLMVCAAGMGAGGLIYRAGAANPTAQAAPPAAGRADDKPKDAKPAQIAARPERIKPKFTLSKETTYLTGPLDKDGYVDYETALNEKLAEGVDPQKNANVLLWQALRPEPRNFPMPAEFFRWLKIAEPPRRGEYFLDLNRYAKYLSNVEELDLEAGKPIVEIFTQRSRTTQRPWVANDYPRIAGWLKANEKPLALVREATGRPDYYNPPVSNKSGDEGWYGLIGALMPGPVECYREVAPALAARAMLHAGEGRLDAAWEDLLACERLGRLIASGADYDEYLVGVGITQVAADAELALLDCARPTAKQAQKWQRDRERLSPIPPLADTVDLGMRYTFLNTVMLARRHPVKTLRLIEILKGQRRPPLPDPDPEPSPAFIASLDWDAILRTGNARFDRVVAAQRIKDRAQRQKELDRIAEELKPDTMTPAEVIMALRIKSLRQESGRDNAINKKLAATLFDFRWATIRFMQRLADLHEQRQRNLQLAFALAAYRGEHKRYPDKLEDLAPKYLAEVPCDLFSGKALFYRPSKDRYLLYSVGVNGQDDGGRGSTDTPPGDDPHVRMPLPALPKK
jgi:RNA polymerase sigma factor (sigma-70 family)